MVDSSHGRNFVDDFFKKQLIVPRSKKSRQELEEGKKSEETK